MSGLSFASRECRRRRRAPLIVIGLDFGQMGVRLTAVVKEKPRTWRVSSSEKCEEKNVPKKTFSHASLGFP